MKFILCCVTSGLSDNLTEMRQTGLSRKNRIHGDFVKILPTAFRRMREGNVFTGVYLSTKVEGHPGPVRVMSGQVLSSGDGKG